MYQFTCLRKVFGQNIEVLNSDFSLRLKPALRRWGLSVESKSEVSGGFCNPAGSAVEGVRSQHFTKNPLFKPFDSFSQFSVLFKFQIKPFAELRHRRISDSELRTDCS
jgi:hypothetical protein